MLIVIVIKMIRMMVTIVGNKMLVADFDSSDHDLLHCNHFKTFDGWLLSALAFYYF